MTPADEYKQYRESIKPYSPALLLLGMAISIVAAVYFGLEAEGHAPLNCSSVVEGCL